MSDKKERIEEETLGQVTGGIQFIRKPTATADAETAATLASTQLGLADIDTDSGLPSSDPLMTGRRRPR